MFVGLRINVKRVYIYKVCVVLKIKNAFLMKK